MSGEEPAPKRRSKKKKLALGLLALVLGTPLAVVAAGVTYLRHVPYSVPPEQAAPAPPADRPQGGLTMRWLGISGFVISDGTTTVLADPVVTRPTVLELISGPLEPDTALIEQHVPERVDYVLVNHAHFDHGLDAPAIALRSGATVVGSPSTINLCRSRGVPEAQLIEVNGGEHLTLGTFEVDVRAVSHSPVLGRPNPMPGVVPPDAGELWFWEYTQDGCRVFRLEGGGTSLWFHPTSMHVPGELGLEAENLVMGVSGAKFTRQTADDVLAEVKPSRFIPTHYDNFFQPLSKGLALIPTIDLADIHRVVLESDPELDWWLLDHDQTVYLPPSPPNGEPR